MTSECKGYYHEQYRKRAIQQVRDSRAIAIKSGLAELRECVIVEWKEAA